MAGKRKGMTAAMREGVARQSVEITIDKLDHGVVSGRPVQAEIPQAVLDWALGLVEVAFKHRSPEEAHAAVDRAFEWLETPETPTLDSPLANVSGILLRHANILEAHGILTVAQFLACSEDRLLSIENFGDKSLAAINAVLAKAGLKRAESVR